jgi:hypothetical protein
LTTRPEAIVALVQKIRPALEEHIWPLLAGQPAEMQGAVLADLLAIWLAGHHVAGDEDATRTMRAELLAVHCGMVRELTSINARLIGTTP